MTSTTPRRPFPVLNQLPCLVGALLLAAGCGSSGPGATSGGITCNPGDSIDCVGPGSCAGTQVCQSAGHSYGTCNCPANTTGGSSTGARGTTGSSSGGSSTGGTTTGGVMPTQLIGTTVTPEGPGTFAVDLSINASGLTTTPVTPDPGGYAKVTGTWNGGISSLSGTYDIHNGVLAIQSDAYGANFSGMLASGVISGEWVGGSYHWPFSMVPIPSGETGYAFCGVNSGQTGSLGVAFAGNGPVGGVDGPGPNMPSATAGPLTGSDTNNLVTVDTIGNFMLLTDSDGGLSFDFTGGTGWSMSPCE